MLFRPAAESDLDAIERHYTELLTHEAETGRSTTNWSLGVYPTRQTGVAAGILPAQVSSRMTVQPMAAACCLMWETHSRPRPCPAYRGGMQRVWTTSTCSGGAGYCQPMVA